MNRLQALQNEYINRQDEKAQLVGPLVAITMLIRSDLLPFARDRYSAIVTGPLWRVAEEHILDLRNEVERLLEGPISYEAQQRRVV